MSDPPSSSRSGTPSARQATNASSSSHTTLDSSGPGGSRRSIFGSIRNRFGKKSDAGAASDRSPLANPSPATRRPRGFNEPPPPYTAAQELPAAVPAPTAAPAPAPAPVPAAAPAPAPQHVPTPDVFITRAASPAPSNRSANSRLTIDNVRSGEDPYAFLATFDTVFVIDDSGSMAGRPWREVHAVLSAIVPICAQRDADGIDIYFLNHRCTPEQQEQLLGRPQQPRVPPGKSAGGFHNVRDVATVGRIFQAVRPGRSTPTGMRLRTILQPYLRFYEAKRNEMEARGEYGDPDPEDVKPMNIIVITDGVPTDDLEDVLVTVAKKLDSLDAPPYQVGVQFFQVGTERDAAKYLHHLDNSLGQNEPTPIRDMVDTVTWDLLGQGGNGGGGGSTDAAMARGLTAESILKVVLGAVVKRLDNESAGTRGGQGRRSSSNTLHP